MPTEHELQFPPLMYNDGFSCEKQKSNLKCVLHYLQYFTKQISATKKPKFAASQYKKEESSRIHADMICPLVHSGPKFSITSIFYYFY